MWLFKNLAIFAFICIFISFLTINSQIIYIRLLPDELTITNAVIYLPTFVVILIFTTLGLLLGVVSEFLRTWTVRKLSQKRLREVANLHAEVEYLKNGKTSETDEIIGLLK